MKNNTTRVKVAGVLIILGGLAFATRLLLQTDIGVPAGESVWQLSWEARFKVEEPPGVISFLPPRDRNGQRLIKQELVHPNLRIVRDAKKDSQQITAIARKKGAYLLQASYLIHIPHELDYSDVTLSAEQREFYTTITPDLDIKGTQGARVLEDLTRRATAQDQLLQLIFDYVSSFLPAPRTGTTTDIKQIFKTGRADSHGKVLAMLAMCRAAKVPARLIVGFQLTDDPDAHPIYWLEVYERSTWLPFDPEGGYAMQLPSNYLPVRTDGIDQIFILDGGKDLEIGYEVYQQDVPQGLLRSHEKRLRDLFDLNRLSLDMRNALALLLLLPLGALLTFVFRQVTGLSTFGNFTPALLGLAAVYADPVTAAVIFLVVAVIGIAGRAAPVTRGLMRSPRLGIVFTLVAVSMTLAVSLMDYYNLNPTGHIVLLPMVVLTSVIDRVYRTLDDLGIKQVILRAVWTALVGVGCFLIIGNPRLARLVITFPEIHFLTLAMILLISVYKGPRLVDMPGFKWLATDEKTAAEEPVIAAIDTQKQTQ